MDEDNRVRTLEMLSKEFDLADEYTFYRIKCKEAYSKPFIDKIKARKMTTRDWLYSLNEEDYKKFPKLYLLLNRIFACVPSSASSERCFSGFGYIDSPLRNRLKKKRS